MLICGAGLIKICPVNFGESGKSIMAVDIITSENPYILDYLPGDKKRPALTRKNADFIEAVIHLDSNYAKDYYINEPSVGYDPEIYAESSNGKYCGSTAYWFNEMKTPNCNFRKCVLGAVIAIDSANSTHLEASVSGRKTMRDIICNKCNNYLDLIDMLNTLFKPLNHNHLIALLTTKTISKKDGKIRFNISFATKFCAYASIFLNSKIQYSKYDNIVSDALPYYSEIYLNEHEKQNEYKINDTQRRKLDEEGNFQYRLNVYSDYQKKINRIIEKLKSDGINLTIEEFDHIVWYGLKG